MLVYHRFLGGPTFEIDGKVMMFKSFAARDPPWVSGSTHIKSLLYGHMRHMRKHCAYFFRASPRHVQQPSEAMSCRARQRTMNSCSLGNLGVVNSGRWRKMVSNVTTLILFCVGKWHLCGKIDASLCVTTSFAGHGGYMEILAGHSSGSGPHPQSLGSMPCRRKAHHGGVSKESSVRSWGRLSMGFVGDWTGPLWEL